MSKIGSKAQPTQINSVPLQSIKTSTDAIAETTEASSELLRDQFEAKSSGAQTAPVRSNAEVTTGLLHGQNPLRLQLPNPQPMQTSPEQTTKGSAERLHKAMQGWGTNHKEIFRVLHDRTSAEIELIREDYQARFGTSLDGDLKAELEGNQWVRANVLLQGENILPVKRDVALLRGAMEGFGTDEKAVLDALYGTTSEEREAIAEEYFKQTGRSLKKDIQKEHSGDNRIYAMAIFDRGDIEDADKLRAAMRGIGTDESLIYRSLEGHEPDELKLIEEDYTRYYGRNLSKDLKKELSGSSRIKALALLKKGHLSGADQLKMAMQGIRADRNAIFNAFDGTTDEERSQIVDEYNKEYGDLNKDLKEHLSRTQLEEVQSLIENGSLSPAQKLNRAMRGLGTDESGVFQALEGLSQEELRATEAEYLERFNCDLKSHLREELGGVKLEKALTLLENGQLNLAEKIHFATHEKNVDPETLFEFLRQASSSEREQLSDAFAKQYGDDVLERIQSKTAGSLKLKAEYLLKHGALNLQQSIQVAVKGAGTREHDLFAAIEKASPQEREAIQSNELLMAQLEAELSDQEMSRAELLLERGYLTRTEQIHYALYGAGTDEALLFQALEGLSPAERLQLQEDFKAEYGQELVDALKADLSQREFWKAEDALAMPPTTFREMLDRAEVRAARERGEGSLFSEISDTIMDLFSMTGKDIDQEIREYRHIVKETTGGGFDKLEATPLLLEKEKNLVDLTTTYLGEKEKAAATIASISTMSVASASLVATAGMAAIPAIATAATSSGITKAMTKKLIIGNSYDLAGTDGLVDFAAGASEGLAMVTMGQVANKASAAIGKQILAAQGKDVSAKGLMLLGREALRQSGEEITQELVEKASEKILIQATKDFFAKSVVHKASEGAVFGAIKGSVFNGITKGVRAATDKENWEIEFSDAVREVLKEAKDGAIRGGKSWAIAHSALKVGGLVSEAMIAKINHNIGTQIAGDLSFTDSELLEAGKKFLGDDTSQVTEEVLRQIGREQLLIQKGQEFLAGNAAGQMFDIVAEQTLKRGTAAALKTLLNNLDNHDLWNDGLLDALYTILDKTGDATIKGVAQWGGKDAAMKLAKDAGVVDSGTTSEALLASLIWRSVSAGIK